MKRILHTLHKLHTEQTAQGMVFGAISLFLMASSVGLVHNSGVITSRRVQAQTAADAGAYAGALTSANILSDVAWMNDGMAYIYYNLMRYAVDVTVTRAVAEMRTHNKWYLWNGNTYPDIGYIDPKPLSQEYRNLERLIGTDDPEQAYADAYDKAAKMIPKGERWLKLMTRMEYAMLAAGKYLVRDAVYKAAVGSSASAETDDERNIAAVAIVQNLYDVNFLTTGAEDIDLIIEYDADGAPLWSFIENGKLYAEIWKLGPDHWRMVRPGIQSIDIFRFGDQDWEIRTGDLIARITKNSDGSIELTVTGTTAAHLTLIPVGDNMWLISGTAAGVSVQYKPFRDGGYELTVNGVTVGIRFSGGKLQQFVGGNWVDLPSPDTVDIGGEQVKVNISNHIDLPGNASLDFPGKLNLGPISFTIPDQIHFAGMDITLLRDSVKITGRIGRVGIVIDGSKDNCAVVEGLSTCDDASGKKRATHNPDGHDRIETLIPGKKWQYKWRAIEPMTVNDFSKLGLHAVADAELRSRKKEEWALEPDLDRNGWFDVRTGDAGYDVARRYYQTVPCWNPADKDHDGRVPGGRCPTCNSLDQRIPDPADPNHRIIDKDGDGKSDVRKYGTNGIFKLEKIGEARDFQEIIIDGIDPRVATESVFAHPLIVAVWIRPDNPFLGSRIDRSGATAPFFRNPECGYFAVACARIGVYSGWEDEARAIADDPSYRFTFDDAIDDYDFAAADAYDVRAERREAWLTSYHNLYEPVWTARLWWLAEGMKSTDFQIAYRQDELGQEDEICRNFVWRVLQNDVRNDRFYESQQDPTIWHDPHVKDARYLRDPDHVPQASFAFRHNFQKMKGGAFQVDLTTNPDDLENAIQH